ncbi:YHYH protein [Roseibium sp.]|uniref:YHYH protein n=1 Tax=Roseibium sp. TaxID=1936156 RepID=UPI003BAB4646
MYERPWNRISLASVALLTLSMTPAFGHEDGHGNIPADASPAMQAFLAHVSDDAMMQEAEIVDCTLSGGTKTKCIKLVLKQTPDYEPGPWCPSSVTDGPEAAGIWIKDGKVYDADGAFVENLSKFYDDPKWKMYNSETGEVLVTKSFDACFGAARVDVWKEYYYYCAQCETDQTVASPINTYFIPLNPVKAEKSVPLADQPGAGLAMNGVRFEGPAPLSAILKAYNIAPFDDCGGHVNPFAGYHYHFVTGCVEGIADPDGHAAQVGISIDGYGLYRQLNVDGREPQDLDQCRGHSSEELGYHYHVSALGVNSIIGCITGELGCVSPPGTQSCDATKRHAPPKN